MAVNKGTIGILTGGGDVPGLNPAIRAVTFRAIREGYKVVGIKRGWGGLVDLIPDKKEDNSENFIMLTADTVNRAGRTGGTFLHTSRTNPSKLKKSNVPGHLKDKYTEDVNDVTEDVLKTTRPSAEAITCSLTAALRKGLHHQFYALITQSQLVQSSFIETLQIKLNGLTIHNTFRTIELYFVLSLTNLYVIECHLAPLIVF